MSKLKSLLLLLVLLLIDQAMALPHIDYTCTNCDRRYLDSINVYNRRPIRVNQVGYKADATHNKHAFAADYPAGTTFKVINATTGAEAYNGTLELITNRAPKPGIYVNGAFNESSGNQLYSFGSNKDSIATATEALYRADFSKLTTPGRYYVVIDKDTSATFFIDSQIYNAIFETAIKFFGIQRCGNGNSQMHAPCHLKDGSALGTNYDLTGGWHDCGDHFKVGETVAYSAYVLSTTFLVYQEKAEDRYGNSYDDTVFTDGIPDVLYEAKLGVDYIFKLYKASKRDGLIEKSDMYHSVGVSDGDHLYWDVPEKQDAQSFEKGGPDRPVAKQIGANVSGMFAAALANVGYAWQVYDAAYADSLIEAAKDIYEHVVKPAFLEGRMTTDDNNYYNQFYTGQGRLDDDAAAAAASLWYATKDTTYAYDLFKNKKFAYNGAGLNMHNNLYEFGGGFMASHASLLFTQGGWATDYQNIHAHVLFFLSKLIFKDSETAAAHGITETERSDLYMRMINTFYRMLDDATAGDSVVQVNDYGSITTEKPYGLVWTSFDWGVNRYNLGVANAFFMLYEITGEKPLLNVSLDNIYYSLGANPWDIDFLMGTGEKNLNHPHNRTSNPDGYNAGGFPYEYRCPKGALMGGRAPHLTLLDDWEKYTATETCIDFTAQLLMPAQSLAEPLPIDAEGPLFSNIAGTPISETEAVISWDANEVALVTVFYSTSVGGVTQSVSQTKASKGGSVTLTGLTPNQTYYFYLEGMDTKRNISTDDNHGYWYTFTMTPQNIVLNDITICQVDHRSAKIYWWSSDRANGVVKYGTAPNDTSNTLTAEGGAVLFHEAKLTGLKAGTTYYFTVSSGGATSEVKQFTTEKYATYADFDVRMKPTSNQRECEEGKWENCHKFFVSVSNNDTIDYEDMDLRIYFNNPNLSVQGGNQRQCWDAKTQTQSPCEVSFGEAESDGMGGWYLPVHIGSKIAVSGQIVFEFFFMDKNWNYTITYKDLVGSWSLRPHTEESDPEYFKGIDMTKGPCYSGKETDWVEKCNGVTEPTYTKNPYITLYYHGNYIYGYAPDYEPGKGPSENRTVALNFAEPFVSPYYSLETTKNNVNYTGTGSVRKSGNLDYFEVNNVALPYGMEWMHISEVRTDSIAFTMNRNLDYGNNYKEWVLWHNHNANANNSYDCACAVVRSNVEQDSITVPTEQRYLAFTTDTITAFIGKIVEVKVLLFDSDMEQITTENMTLTPRTVGDVAQFYLNTEAAAKNVPSSTIPMENGVATFYVIVNTAVQTPITVEAPSVSTPTVKYDYVTAKAILNIEELPPYPIIDVAKMVDTDCDNVPDAMDITLTNEYQSEEGQSFSSITFEYNGKEFTSSDGVPNDKKLLVKLAGITDTNTAPSGGITLSSKTKDGIQSALDIYTDGIGPALRSVSVLERIEGATADFVFLQFTESIAAPGTLWPVQLYSNGGQPVDAPTVISSRIYNDSLNIWQFEVAFNKDGSSVVTENMFAQLLATSGITDKVGNPVSQDCPQPRLLISLKIMPIPMTFASISDLDQDGLAEHVEIKFTKAVDAKHKPNSISVEFGTAQPETLWVSSYNFVGAGDSISMNLEKPFRLGNTRGNYENGAGLVTEHLGTGASYETATTLAVDKAGPVFVAATLASSGLEFLTLTASETLNPIDTANLALYERERGPINVYKRSLSRLNLTQNNTTLAANYSAEDEIAVIEGDRVRFAPTTLSAFSDANGNLPATNNPWITIGSNANPKIKTTIAIATATNNIVSINPNTSTAVPDNKTIRTYILNPTTGLLDVLEDGLIKGSIDTAATPLQGVVWKIGLAVPRGTSINEPAAWSSLKIKYNIPIYTNLGNYVNRVKGSYTVSPNTHLSKDNQVTLFVEWVNIPGNGVCSEEGRAVGTGAYIYKAEMEYKFTPNTSIGLDEKNIKRFSTKSSYEKTNKFGIKRTK